MYVNDHEPPRIHARYGGRKVVLDIRTMQVMRGRIHPRAPGLLVEWASLHRTELMASWEVASHGSEPGRIPPLG